MRELSPDIRDYRNVEPAEFKSSQDRCPVNLSIC